LNQKQKDGNYILLFSVISLTISDFQVMIS